MSNKENNNFKLLILCFIVILTIGSAMMLLLCSKRNTNQKVNAEANDKYERKEDETMNYMMVYVIDRETFYKFIDCPSLSVLQEQAKRIQMLSNLSGGIIRCKDANSASMPIQDLPEGVMRLGSLPVYSSLIDFVATKDVLEEYLGQKEIAEKIVQASVISSTSIPTVIWVQTEYNNYFIVIDVQLHSIESDYAFCFYTHTDYLEQFRIKDGIISINGNICIKYEAKIHFAYADLPFITLLENMGATINWVTEDVANVVFCEKEYVLNIEKPSLIESGKKYDYLMPAPGGYRFFNTMPHELIIDSKTIQRILRQMGNEISIDIDREKGIVAINY